MSRRSADGLVYALPPEMRAEVLLRDGDICRFCGQLTRPMDRRSSAGRQFARVVPQGDIVPSNLVTACSGCANRRASASLVLSPVAFAERWPVRQVASPLVVRRETVDWLGAGGYGEPAVPFEVPPPSVATPPTAADRPSASPPEPSPAGQRVTRELLATLRPGDVVELRTPADMVDVLTPTEIRGRLVRPVRMDGQPDADALMLGDDRTGLLLLDWDGYAPYWAQTLELTVVKRVPRLYENSTRTEPTPGDIVRDSDGDAWVLNATNGWSRTNGPALSQHSPLDYAQPLVLLWDGAAGSLPGATS